MFQFHNGSIKRKIETPIPQWFEQGRSFNSTMVRLKDVISSILTRNQMFQFHNGSIKRIDNG